MSHVQDISNNSHVTDIFNMSHVVDSCNISHIVDICNLSHVTEICNTSHLVNSCDISHVLEMCNSSHMTDICNTSSVNQPVYYPELKHTLPMMVILCFSYGLVFLLAVVGNFCVLFMVCKNRRSNAKFEILLGNLAMADLTVALMCIPINLLDSLYSGEWFAVENFPLVSPRLP